MIHHYYRRVVLFPYCCPHSQYWKIVKMHIKNKTKAKQAKKSLLLLLFLKFFFNVLVKKDIVNSHSQSVNYIKLRKRI